MNGLPTADVGVPLIIIALPDQVALTPAGKPFAPGTPLFEIPVAPVVVCVILVIAEFTHTLGVLDATLTVFRAEVLTVN